MLKVIFCTLPDTNRNQEIVKIGLLYYGRFALLKNDDFWFGDIMSSHPMDTKYGWYWAISKCGNLIISSRGSINNEGIIANNFSILKWLITQLIQRRIIQKPKSIDISVGVST